MKDFNTFKTKLNKIKSNNSYWKAIKKPIREMTFLLEAGQGKNVNGNMFALLRHIKSRDDLSNAEVYLSIEPNVLNAAKEKLHTYSISGVKFVVRNSNEYKEILATAKYLLTDNSFPAYFYKRPEQIYINTWHGTPLKTLGRSDISNATSIANVQANMLKADYLLHPNDYTKDVMMRDYMVNRLFKNKTIVIDYPRNDALFTKDYQDEILEKYKLQGKRLIAYMPTWRGVGRIANIDEQIRDANKIIEGISSSLGENEILCVNLHFLIGNNIDVSKYRQTMMFPSEYETYDFLALCDTLITDYSSVALDFALTGKEVILHMYDYEEYKEAKGFYFDIRTLPFKQTYELEDLKKEIHSPARKYDLDKKFVGNNMGKASQALIDLMCFGKEDGLKIEDYSKENKTNMVYVENIIRPDCISLMSTYLKDLSDADKENTVIAFENKINDEVANAIRELDSKIDVIRIEHETFKGMFDAVSTYLNNRFGIFKNRANKFYQREKERLIDILNIDTLTVLMVKNLDRVFSLSFADAKTCLYRLPSYFYRHNGALINKRQDLYNNLVKSFDEVKEMSQQSLVSAWKDTDCYGVDATMSHNGYSTENGKLVIKGKLRVETEADFNIKDTANICERDYDLSMSNVKSSLNGNIKKVTADAVIEIPLIDMEDFIKLNRIFIDLETAAGTIRTAIAMPNFRNKLSMKKIPLLSQDLDCFIKGSKMYLTLEIRKTNVTDAMSERIKLFFAWLCSLATPQYKPVILFEKECDRYEESASVVYERLMDLGYKNVYFILNRYYEHWDEIPEKYRDHIINRFSFKHYYNLFAAKSFVSTEMLGHALEISASSKLFQDKVVAGDKNYVFLQHGVMYMVSLSSESRIFFRRKSELGLKRVVVSSSLEAKHFTGYTPYTDEELYVSGLPKFDKAVLDKEADLITIMLTWRPWEYVSAVKSFENTKYYKMLHRIIDAVPDKYKDKVVVLPHPRIAELAEASPKDDVWKYMLSGIKYNDILKKTKILITDYSSISYDAFYRGSNVIFCWGEKDECMLAYGQDTKLMLTEDLAFGPVAYDENIGEIIDKSYNSGQENKYIENYRKIVEFHDNQNTDRVIQMMKRDKIIG